MLKGQHYEINILAGANGLDPVDDNVDVEVVFDDGSRYMATFFTLRNLERIMARWEQTGECMKGFYFWASDMIIIRTLSRESIATVVAELIETGEFQSTFSTVSLSS